MIREQSQKSSSLMIRAKLESRAQLFKTNDVIS